MQESKRLFNMQGIQGNIFTCKLNHLDHTHNPPVTCHFSNKKFKILYLVLNYPIECSLRVPLWSHPFHYHSNHNLGPPACLCLTQLAMAGMALPMAGPFPSLAITRSEHQLHKKAFLQCIV